MESFKNFYIRNDNVVQLQKTSFESPLITTNSSMYYGNLSLAQKQNFKWAAGGNIMIPLGPILINNTTVWETDWEIYWETDWCQKQFYQLRQ